MNYNDRQYWFDRLITGNGGQFNPYNIKDKDRVVSDYVGYWLDRTQSIFKWEGLPDTIPQRILELFLQINGNVFITDIETEGLRVYCGGLGGAPDVYYQQSLYTISNPKLSQSYNLVIDKDGILIRNDALMKGLLPLFSKYATQLSENEISMNIASINSRLIQLFSAIDENKAASIKKVMENILNGDYGVIVDDSGDFIESIKPLPYGTAGQSNTITQLIELEQYLKSSWCNEIGLNANYNMKRESINSNEAQLNNDFLLPFIDDMLNQRKKACEQINAMYGLNLSVSLNSSWEDINNEVMSDNTEETEVTEDEEITENQENNEE